MFLAQIWTNLSIRDCKSLSAFRRNL